tara:strand:+ start:53 stop:4261 length:4209 start_codon:yes stop_codon:yes gene_type:complete
MGAPAILESPRPRTPYTVTQGLRRRGDIALPPLITILMRCTYRPEQFKMASRSVLHQSYKRWRLVMSYDDDRCLEYLQPLASNPKVRIVRSIEVDRTQRCFYNLYMNPLVHGVTDGWIIVLDDDDMFASPDSLFRVAQNLSSPDVLATWPHRRGHEIIKGVWNRGLAIPGTIASCSYCVHSSRARESRWRSGQRGDYAFLYGILQQGPMQVRHLRPVLTKSVRDDQRGGNFGAVEEVSKQGPATVQMEERPLGKISIVMPYYNRKKQALATLKQFDKLYAGKYDFEVIIVDDASDAKERLTNVQSLFRSKIKYVQLENKTWINPVVALNTGISNVSSDCAAIVLQSPEVFHCGDVLSHVTSNLTDENYIVYPVFDSPTYEANDHLYELAEGAEGVDYMASFVSKWETSTANADRVKPAWKGWLQHPVHNDRQFHFLSAITKGNMDKLGAFDDKMRDGLWYEDVDFLNRAKQIAEVVSARGPMGVHLKHEGGTTHPATHEDIGMLQKNRQILDDNLANGVVGVAPPATSLVASSPPDLSIVMAYYNRKPQTLETLKGFERSYAGKHNFEVVIVDDNSNAENRLEEDIQQFSFPINLIVISAEEKGDRVNPCTAFNKGFAAATGEIIMIQNPECYHVGDILKHAMDNLGEQDYFAYSCYTVNTPALQKRLFYDNANKYEKIRYEIDRLQEHTRTCTGLNENLQGHDLEWLNSPSHRTYYHFCSCLYRSKLNLIGGFDERFASGYCFDDDELLLSIKHNLRLNITIVAPEWGMVVHQYHTRNAAANCEAAPDSDPIKQKWLRNKRLLEGLKAEHEKWAFSYPKMMFLYWDGSPLSYLNYLTVVSFNHYNPGWKIIVYMPIERTEGHSWKTHEQKIKYAGPDYMDKLRRIHNVVIRKVSFNGIGFFDEASEVIKSDYFRYHILHKHGGLWSDFDIMYTGSIGDKMSFDEETIIFKTYIAGDNGSGYYVYPIGMFLCQPRSTFFSYLVSKCVENYDPNEYQSIGAVMLSRLAEERALETIEGVRACNEDYYLPWAYNQLEQFLGYGHVDNVLPDANVGIHWFNGADRSKRYAIELEDRLNNFEVSCYLDRHVAKHNVQVRTGPGSRTADAPSPPAKRDHKRKLSIVMAYFNRKDQLAVTLDSIAMSPYLNKEIIIVDDNSREDQRPESLIEVYKKTLDIKLITIQEHEKTWVNPCIPYNIGIREARGEIVVLQNPEVMHVGDCLSFINEHLREKDWMSFNCYGSPGFGFNARVAGSNASEVFDVVAGEKVRIGGNSVERDDVGGWLNHYEDHFVAYHYLAAIHKADIHGPISPLFDENFQQGVGADDDELIKRLIHNGFRFKISNFVKNKPFCLHLFHEKPQQLRDLDFRDNKRYFAKCCEEMGMVPENNIVLAPVSETPLGNRVLL